MKTFIIIILSLFLSTNSLYSQFSEATIYFPDSSSIKGLADLRGNYKIKFKETEDAETRIYSFYEIDRLSILLRGKKRSISLQNVNDKKKPIAVELVFDGKVQLYRTSKVVFRAGGWDMGNPNSPSAPTPTSGISEIKEKYYIKRVQDDQMIDVTTHELFRRNFRSAAILFFPGCPELKYKLENKIYKKKDLKQIVRFYNFDCK